jgi:hypothetical protein
VLAGPASATVPPGEGTFVLPDGGVEQTEYVTVPVGMAVVYETASDSYVSYWGEVQGPRTVAGGDGGGMQGCLASSEPFAFRMRWSNDDIVPMPDATITYRLRVVADPGGCDDVGERVAARGGDPPGPPGFGREAAPFAVAYLSMMAVGVAVTFGVFRAQRPKAPGRRPSPVRGWPRRP